MNYIKTIHDEYRDNGDVISILIELNNKKIINTYILLFTHGIYCVFHTINDCYNYMVHKINNENLGFLDEQEFDDYYDNGIKNGDFASKVNWWIDDNLLK